MEVRAAEDFQRFVDEHPEYAEPEIEEPAPEPSPRKQRRRLAFTKRDVTRAIAAHMAAGLSVQRVEIDPSGRIIIVTGQQEPAVSITTENEWDSVQ
jgi:hypothetical protein